MADLLKTWPAFMERRKVLRVFGCDRRNIPFSCFYFTLGRGRPKQEVGRLFFTHQGEILGSFQIGELKQNDGSLPKLRSIDNRESEWQIKRDAWVAICPAPFALLDGQVYHEGFRGWRYFNLDEYSQTLEAKIPL